MKKISRLIYLIVFAAILTACTSSAESTSNKSDKVKIGVTGGPPEEVTNIVKELAAEEGIELEVTPFSDYLTPNKALANGELDLNMFQAKQFLANYVKDHGDDLAPVGTVYNSTLGVFSEKYDTLDALPEGATIGIANDVVNLGRCLKLLEEAGLITLTKDNPKGTVADIVNNPKNFQFKELDVNLMLSTLRSLDAGLAASTHALKQGLNPIEDSIYLEKGGEYPMVLAAKSENVDSEIYKRILELYHSEEVVNYINENYEDVIIVTENPTKFDW